MTAIHSHLERPEWRWSKCHRPCQHRPLSKTRCGDPDVTDGWGTPTSSKLLSWFCINQWLYPNFGKQPDLAWITSNSLICRRMDELRATHGLLGVRKWWDFSSSSFPVSEQQPWEGFPEEASTSKDGQGLPCAQVLYKTRHIAVKHVYDCSAGFSNWIFGQVVSHPIHCAWSSFPGWWF